MYGSNNQMQGVATVTQSQQPLDRISGLAANAELAADRVQRFLDRFFSGASTDAANALAPVPTGYNGQIGRLETALGALNEAVNRLEEIG